mmetsp:Transcript_10765/g.33990  ORF Transcript_10765/g.33990 Transcript_10765/m.33990 type:complete len:371 (+) Transcript_10765:440-1552(+)
MSRFSRLPGCGNSIFRSRRPGRRSAGSSVSARFVAMMTLTLTDWSKPSIWLSSSSRMRCTSRSAPVCASKRFVAIASTSSMKMIAGAFSRASRKTSRTMRGPSPRYFWTNSEPTTRIKDAVVWCATAFASIVLPVPGGPSMMTPRGILAPTLANLAGFFRNSTTSKSSCLDESQPATSSKVTPVSGSSCSFDLACPMLNGVPPGPMPPPGPCERERRNKPPRRTAGKAREPRMSNATLGCGRGSTLKRTLCFSRSGTRFLSPMMLTARTTPSTSVAARRRPSSEKVTTSTLSLSTASRKSEYDHTPRASAAPAGAPRAHTRATYPPTGAGESRASSSRKRCTGTRRAATSSSTLCAYRPPPGPSRNARCA